MSRIRRTFSNANAREGREQPFRAPKTTSRGRRLRPRLRLIVVEARSYFRFNTASLRRLDPQAITRRRDAREVVLEALASSFLPPLPRAPTPPTSFSISAPHMEGCERFGGCQRDAGWLVGTGIEGAIGIVADGAAVPVAAASFVTDWLYRFRAAVMAC